MKKLEDQYSAFFIWIYLLNKKNFFFVFIVFFQCMRPFCLQYNYSTQIMSRVCPNSMRSVFLYCLRVWQRHYFHEQTESVLTVVIFLFWFFSACFLVLWGLTFHSFVAICGEEQQGSNEIPRAQSDYWHVRSRSCHVLQPSVIGYLALARMVYNLRRPCYTSSLIKCFISA